jgi:hypothetical protein
MFCSTNAATGGNGSTRIGQWPKIRQEIVPFSTAQNSMNGNKRADAAFLGAQRKRNDVSARPLIPQAKVLELSASVGLALNGQQGVKRDSRTSLKSSSSLWPSRDSGS